MDADFSDGKYFALLATVDEEGKPRVRPVVGLLISRKVYFSTKAAARKAREVASNPPVELLVLKQNEKGLGYVRFSGEAFRIFDEELVQEILSRSAYSPKQYIRIGDHETIALYEVIPTRIERYLPDEKREQDISTQFLSPEGT
jgi:uncharacterized pyridoxamine 5'-phosphate oxidase family protein